MEEWGEKSEEWRAILHTSLPTLHTLFDTMLTREFMTSVVFVSDRRPRIDRVMD
jgi:hypothetical protein